MTIQKNIVKFLFRAALACFPLLSSGACEKKLEFDRPGPVTFQVEVTSGEVGSAEAPIPFSHEPVPYTLSARAIDKNGELADWFNDTVHVRIEPRGEFPLTQETEFTATNGVVENIEVTVRDLHSTAAIWVEHLGTDETPGSYATGLSPVLTAVKPTLRNVQEVDDGKYQTSALKDDFVEIDFENRTAVVTGVFSDGFYVTDVSEPDFAYSSLFVYSYSYPNVAIGDLVVQLNGSVDEFFGFTELGFPSWKVSGATDAPDPIRITSAIVGDNDLLEQYESAFVEVTDVTVCPVGSDFATYGQWAVLVDPSASCSGDTGKINVISTYTVPDFAPSDHQGEVLGSVKGNLRYHSSADPSWIIYTRFDGDVTTSGD